MTATRNSRVAQSANRAAKGEGRRTKGGSARAVKVWHITDFKHVFELADDKRKDRPGPLSYTKSFVSLSAMSKPYETLHCERLQDLKARPERHLLRSVFEDLKNWAGKKPLHHRGYLVDAEGKPADLSYIAAQLDHLPKEDLKKAMKILAQIGLIERVTLNGELSPAETEKPEKPKRKPQRKEALGKRRNVSKGQGRDSSGSNRKAVGIRPETDDAPFKKETAIPSYEGKRENEQKATNGARLVGSKKNSNGNGKGKNQSAEALRNPSEDEVQQPSCTEGPKPSPPASPPLSSREPHGIADEGGRGRTILFTRPLDSVTDFAAAPSRQGQTYGRRVFLSLKLPWPIDSIEAAREIGSFASKHDDLCRKCSALSPPQIDTLLNRGLKEAAKMSRRSANRNRGAVWNTAMNRIIAKHSGTAGQGRSPPASEKAG